MVRIHGEFKDGSETVYLIPRDRADEVASWLRGLGVCTKVWVEDNR